MTPPASPLSSTSRAALVGDKTELMRLWRMEVRSNPAARGWKWALGIAAVLTDMTATILGIYLVGYASSARTLPPALQGTLTFPSEPVWVLGDLARFVSYGAFGFAWFLANLYLALLLAQPRHAERWQATTGLAVRTIQLGMIFLAAALVLAGLRQSHTRLHFWNWGPDEFAAVIILAGYVILLGAREAGWVRDFGVAAGSIVGFAPVVCSACGAEYILGIAPPRNGLGPDNSLWIVWTAVLNSALLLHAGLRYRTPSVQLS